MTATISRLRTSNWTTSDIPNLRGKTALITGKQLKAIESESTNDKKSEAEKTA